MVSFNSAVNLIFYQFWPTRLRDEPIFLFSQGRRAWSRWLARAAATSPRLSLMAMLWLERVSRLMLSQT